MKGAALNKELKTPDRAQCFSIRTNNMKPLEKIHQAPHGIKGWGEGAAYNAMDYYGTDLDNSFNGISATVDDEPREEPRQSLEPKHLLLLLLRAPYTLVQPLDIVQSPRHKFCLSSSREPPSLSPVIDTEEKHTSLLYRA